MPRRKYTIDDMNALAAERGGECLSDAYINNRTKLRWRCTLGHEWDSAPSSIQSGKWCRQCYIISTRMSPGEASERHAALVELAANRGGELLSSDYKGTNIPLRWRCRFGHEWEAAPRDVKNQGTWCKTCSKGMGERTCRLFFEQAFEAPFPTKRPAWLISPRSGRMELDGYCEDLSLAFEHHGMYHYKEIEIHQREGYDLATRQAYDQHKRALCAKHGVLLIEVPEVGTLTTADGIKPLVINAMNAAKRPIPVSLAELAFDPGQAYTTANYDFCVELAEKKGGKLLTPGFVEWHTIMLWRCIEGHEWEASASQLRHSGTWCPVCSNRAKHTVERLQELAGERGGKCLSIEYTGAHEVYEWQCEKGHRWTTSYTNVQRGSWCPHCAGQGTGPGLIERYNNIATERGGECLSEAYINARSKLQFRCAKGHEWWSYPDNVRRGSWCNECANKRRTGRPKE